MFEAIAFAEAIAATGAAIIAIHSREHWRHRAEAHWRAASNFRQMAAKWYGRAGRLDAECDTLAAHLVRLSVMLDKRDAKPGPTKRAAQRAQILSKAAELRGEVAN